MNAGIAWALTVLLFLAWNVPVAAVQAIVSIERLTELLDEAGMEGALSWLETGTIAIATLEGWVASLTLSTMQMLTLYSGVLTLLSRAMGWPSHTMIGISTLNKMWTFNFVLVLLEEGAPSGGGLVALVAGVAADRLEPFHHQVCGAQLLDVSLARARGGDVVAAREGCNRVSLRLVLGRELVVVLLGVLLVVAIAALGGITV